MTEDVELKAMVSKEHNTVFLKRFIRQHRSFKNVRAYNDTVNLLPQAEAAALQQYYCQISTGAVHVKRLRKRYKGKDIIVMFLTEDHAMAIRLSAGTGNIIVFNSTA